MRKPKGVSQKMDRGVLRWFGDIYLYERFVVSLCLCINNFYLYKFVHLVVGGLPR